MLLAVTFKRMGGTADRIELEMIAETGKMTEQIRSFDAAKAQCFKQEDRQRLLAVIEAAFGNFHDFNKDVRGVLASRRKLSIGPPIAPRHSSSITVRASGGMDLSGDVPEEMKQVIESIKLDKQKRRRVRKLRNVFRTVVAASSLQHASVTVAADGSSEKESVPEDVQV